MSPMTALLTYPACPIRHRVPNEEAARLVAAAPRGDRCPDRAGVRQADFSSHNPTHKLMRCRVQPTGILAVPA